MTTETRAEIAQTPPPLAQLQADWLAAKHAEDKCKAERNRLAALIGAHPKTLESFSAKPFGSRQLGALDLKRDQERSWDQSQLLALAEQVEPAAFPFKIEFKEDRKASAELAQNNPAAWALFLPALSTKPGSIALSERKK